MEGIIRLEKSGGRRGNRLPGFPPPGDARLRNDTQPPRSSGCPEGLPDREFRLPRAGLHEPDGLELLGACLILICWSASVSPVGGRCVTPAPFRRGWFSFSPGGTSCFTAWRQYHQEGGCPRAAEGFSQPLPRACAATAASAARLSVRRRNVLLARRNTTCSRLHTDSCCTTCTREQFPRNTAVRESSHSALRSTYRVSWARCYCSRL